MTDNKDSQPETGKKEVQAQPELVGSKEPAAKAEEDAKKIKTGEEATPGPSKKLSKRILLIEDDPPMVKMYSTKLKMEGFNVEIAHDGEEGLKKITEWSPELVVLDLMIPKIGGMDLLEQMRTNARTKNLPVIILSNLSQEQDIQKAKRLGVKEFIVKANFTPGQVVNKISTLLRK